MHAATDQLMKPMGKRGLTQTLQSITERYRFESYSVRTNFSFRLSCNHTYHVETIVLSVKIQSREQVV